VKKMRLAALVGGALALAVLTTAAAVSAKSSKPATINYKVGLVTDIGGLNDHGFNHLAYVGLLRAEKQLGIQGKVVTSTDGTQYVPNLSSLAKDGYNLVIGVGFLQEAAIGQVAKAYPNTKFAGVDMNAPGDFASTGGITNNFEGLIFKEEQVGYEVGYLAGLEAKREGKNTVSSVGGIAVPAVVRYIAGFQAGAKAADPGITTLNGYSNDFVAQDKCKNVALSQIAQGSVVVFQVAGGCGLGALDAAKEKGVWGIGVDADQSYIGPQILTSAQKKVDRAVYVAILDQVKRNIFAGGTNLVFDAKNGGVGLGKVSAKVPASELKATLAIAAKVASGKIVPPTQCSPKPTC
jgi:basic membrane protein A